MFGPTLAGSLVTLTQPRPDCIPDYLRWFADAEVTRYMLVRFPPSEAMEHEWLDRIARSQNDVMWAVEVAGKHVGSVGLHDIDWRNRHCNSGTIIGEKQYWRRGVAGEAMALRTAFAFQELGLEKIKSSAALANQGSIRGLMKAGYQQVGIHRREWYVDGEWLDVWIGEVLREDWLARQRPAE